MPIRGDGSKAPPIRWGPLQERIAEEAEVCGWYPDNHLGVAVIGGGISGNFEPIDFDEDATTIFPAWRELVEAECPGLVDRLSIHTTPDGGFHACYRCVEVKIPGNTQLACKPNP